MVIFEIIFHVGRLETFFFLTLANGKSSLASSEDFEMTQMEKNVVPRADVFSQTADCNILVPKLHTPPSTS